MPRHRFSFFILVLITTMIYACSSNGTKKPNFSSEADSKAYELGKRTYVKLKKYNEIDNDPQTNAYVACVTDRLVSVMHSNYQDIPWQVTVFDNDTPDAFALPSGHIGINTGLLTLAQTQDQLAAIISHEMAHIVADHINQRIDAYLQTRAGLNPVAATNGKRKMKTAAALGAGSYYEMDMPFDDTQETEGDIISMEYMAKAGFNPQASIKFWEKMQNTTHPTTSVRIQEMKDIYPFAERWYKRAVEEGGVANCS